MAGIWQKFLVFRRDGSVPEWPYLVLGGRDPDVSETVRFLSYIAGLRGRDPVYVDGLRELADRMDLYRAEHGDGDPDAPAHREDDLGLLEMWESRRSPDSGA